MKRKIKEVSKIIAGAIMITVGLTVIAAGIVILAMPETSYDGELI